MYEAERKLTVAERRAKMAEDLAASYAWHLKSIQANKVSIRVVLVS